MPLLQIQQRVKECGRIRIGQKGSKGQPEKLTVFRFTSFDKHAIESAAKLYGGTVKPCEGKDLEGQFEVITTVSEIQFITPPKQEPSQYMEMWSGGGCQRRCDGNTELLSGKPCMCNPEDPPNECCKPTTRLSVILPDLPGLGVWRIESHGWNAAVELVETYNMLRTMAGVGQQVEAVLGLEYRKGTKDGKTVRYVVPVIRIRETPRELLQRMSGGGPAIDQRRPESLPDNKPQLPPVLKDANPRGAAFATLHDMGLPQHEDPYKPMYYAVFGKLLKRELTSLSGLSEVEWRVVSTWLRAVKEGESKMPKAFSEFLGSVQNPNAGTGVSQSESTYDPYSEEMPDESDPFEDVPITSQPTEAK